MLEFVIDNVEKNEEKGGISAFSTFSSNSADKIILMLTKFVFGCPTKFSTLSKTNPNI